MSELAIIVITAVTTAVTAVLSLVNIFQLLNNRAKNKALQSFLGAIHDMAKRTKDLKNTAEIQQKSQDICSVVNAAIVTVSGKKWRIRIRKKRQNPKN